VLENEVNVLMWLFERFIVREADELNERKARVTFVGRRDALPERLQRVMLQLEDQTTNNDGLRLEIALNYGGIQSVVDGLVIPEVKPNWQLRKKLEKKSTTELFLMLQKLDLERAKNIDSKNPHRLIRAIEIVKTTGKPIPPKTLKHLAKCLSVLQIGIKKNKKDLKKAIQKRLEKRLKIGMIDEVKKLHKNGQTVVMVTHEYEYTKNVDRIIHIEDGMISKEEKPPK